MLAQMRSSTLRGIEATPIDVEVDVVGGLPSYHVVGLPTPSVREGAVRIRAALDSVGTNVMIANAELEIVYLNPSLVATLREAESGVKPMPVVSSSVVPSGAARIAW